MVTTRVITLAGIWIVIAIGSLFCIESPKNVSIDCKDSSVTLQWDNVKGSEKYYIKKGIDPYLPKPLYDSTFVNIFSENIKYGSNTCFYEITAKNSLPPGMIFVHGGEFIMGDHYSEGSQDELPLRNVKLSNFYIGKYEVSQKEWAEVMGYNPAEFRYGLGDSYPVYNVSWYEIMVYCNKRSIIEGLNPCYKIKGSTDPVSWGGIPGRSDPEWDSAVCSWTAEGYRLPTEAEWEYSSRGVSEESNDLRFAGCMNSSELKNYAWYYNKDFDRCNPVGAKLPNCIGINDMGGNVWELCWDWYGGYQNASSDNPCGQTSGRYRVMRGGSWKSRILLECSVAYRSYLFPYASVNNCGFRIARTPKGSTVDFPAPSNLSVVQHDLHSAVVSWNDNSTGEDKFMIERKLSSDAVFEKAGKVTGSNSLYSSWTDSTVILNNTYDYRVKAVSGINTTDYAVSTGYSHLFYAPSDLTADQFKLYYTKLVWKDNSTGEEKFEIERKLSSDSVYVKVGEASGSDSLFSSWTDSTVVLNNTYDYRIKAVSGINGTDYAVRTGYSHMFNAPSDLSAVQFELSHAKLVWKDNSTGEEKFEIERKLSSDSIYVKVGEASGSDSLFTSWIDSTLFMNMEYDYRIKAVKGLDCSAYALVTRFYLEFKSPSDLTVSQSEIINAELVWKDNSIGEEKFEIERKLSSDSVYVKVGEVSGRDSLFSSWTDSTLTFSHTYDYRVRAICGSSSTGYSVKTGYVCEFKAPSLLTVSKAVITSAKLEWVINSNGQEGFIIDIKKGTGDWQNNYAVVNGTRNSWTENSLVPDVSYSYRVRAYYKTYFSSCSNTVSVSSDFVFVQGGDFIMGDHYYEGFPDELPLHKVTLNDFYIQNTEVRQKDWVEVMGYNPCLSAYGLGDNYPVYGISWYDMIVYCNKKSIRDGIDPCYSISGSKDPVRWGAVPTSQNQTWNAVVCDWKANGYRFLTEAEWEYASRGGIHNSDDLRFSGCLREADLSKYCVYESIRFNETKSKLPNQLGLYDMSGNAIEFVWDWYNKFNGDDQINPVGWKEFSLRVRKCGARYSTPKSQRVSKRSDYDPSYRFTDGEIGFRIGASVPGKEFYAVKTAYPDGSAELQKGTTEIIRWTDNFNENVSIDLYHDGVFLRQIFTSALSNGKISWTVPCDLEEGLYNLRISSMADQTISDFSGEFMIVDDQLNRINILLPSANSLWMKGRGQRIKWNSNFSGNVNIDLYRVVDSQIKPGEQNLEFSGTISHSENNDGVFDWVPDSLNGTGEKYTIVITGLTTCAAADTSDIFFLREYEPQRMVFVEGGSFVMGDSRSEGELSEKPLHNVTLNSFFMSNYEVTQSEWVSVMGKNPTDPATGIYGSNPVCNLNWYSILVYCNKRSILEGLDPCYTIKGSTDPLYWGQIPYDQNPEWDKVQCNWSANGYRFPTEAEWEYASRGGIHHDQNYRFVNSDLEEELPYSAWINSCSGSSNLHEVGTLQPSILGLFDMNGNAWEWCWDWYSYYSGVNQINPKGPSGGTYKIQRGGSISNKSDPCRVSHRDFISISSPVYTVQTGVRLVRSN